MELQPAILATRQLLREGETGKALQTILAALENVPQQTANLHALQVLESNYHATRQQEIRGIVSFPEAQRSYNQINDALLYSIENLEMDRSAAANPAGMWRPVWWLSGQAVLLLIGIGAWFFIKNTRPAASEAKDLTTADCPVFTGSGPKVLILPFKKVGQGAAKPEDVIQSRIQKLSTNKNFPIATQLLTGLDEGSLNPDQTNGEALGRRCGADMVIWGLYDYADSLHIDLRFTAVHNPKSAFATGFQTFHGLPEVQSGKLLNRLDDAIFGICGIIAIRAGQDEVARTWFGKMQEKGPDVQKMEQILDQAGSGKVIH